MRATLFRRHTFRTGVRYSATPSAVPFTVLITFCMTLIEHKAVSRSLKDITTRILFSDPDLVLTSKRKHVGCQLTQLSVCQCYIWVHIDI